MRRARLVYNPKAGRWRTPRLVRSLVDILAPAGFRLEAQPTDSPGHAEKLARAAANEGCEVVFAFGGDGTVREAAAGLLGTDTALGPIPGGTTNVVAHSLSLPSRPQAAASALIRCPIMEIDVGLCGEQIFLMQATAGLDAAILSHTSPRLKRMLGKGAVLMAALTQWPRYPYPPIELIADGRSFTPSFAAVCNLPHYAGRWRLAPQASCQDRSLDLLLFYGSGPLPTLGFARDLVRGKHVARPDVELLPVHQVELRVPRDLCLQDDGDALRPGLPATIRLASDRLRILAPMAG